MSVSFTVLGDPRPQGSKRAILPTDGQKGGDSTDLTHRNGVPSMSDGLHP